MFEYTSRNNKLINGQIDRPPAVVDNKIIANVQIDYMLVNGLQLEHSVIMSFSGFKGEN